MRDEYIKQIQEYITSKKNWERTLKEIKIHALLQGATEEEYNEAVKQISQLNSDKDLKTQNTVSQTKKLSSQLGKKLLEIDIAAHVATACLLLFLLILGAVLFFNKQWLQTANTAIKDHTNLASIIPAQTQSTIIAKVYANRLAVSPEQVFSYPPSNITLAITGTPKKEVFGFFPYWMLSEENNVNMNAITTVSLFGLEVDGGGNIVTVHSDGTQDQGWAMWNDPQLDAFIQRARHQQTKIQLTIKSFNNTNIERLVSSDAAQKQAIANILHLISSKSLEGVNIDFEYSGSPTPAIKDAFTRFMTNLSETLKQQNQNLSVTIDTYITEASIPELIDIEALTNQIDAFIVMGYDMATPAGKPGSIAPMEGETSIVGYLQSYLEKIPPQKIILAVPYYGYDWIVSKIKVATTSDVNQESTSMQSATPVLPYAQIVDTSKTDAVVWDAISQTPWYSYIDPVNHQQHEVHFENTRSLGVKYDYVNEKNLKGIGIWAIGYDGLNTDLSSLILEKFSH